MIQINPKHLRDLRLNQMPAGDRDRLLAEIQQALEVRVDDTMQRLLSDEEAKAISDAKQAGNAEEAEKLLMQRFPNYQDIVFDELTLLKQEIIQNGRIMHQSSSWEFVPYEENPGYQENQQAQSPAPSTPTQQQ